MTNLQIFSKPCGSYETNCYIARLEEGDIIIDPGQGALSWLQKIVQKPLAIICTHGHFDHVWDGGAAKEAFGVPLFIHKNDAFMLQNDIFGMGMPKSEADVLAQEGSYEVGGVGLKFWHFPGHTPGCIAIEAAGSIFTGDFVFKGSIGRVDFPYSKPEDMKTSLRRFMEFDGDFDLYPGHGAPTKLSKERNSLEAWLEYI